jgi:hypothetical protein
MCSVTSMRASRAAAGTSLAWKARSVGLYVTAGSRQLPTRCFECRKVVVVLCCCGESERAAPPVVRAVKAAKSMCVWRR